MNVSSNFFSNYFHTLANPLISRYPFLMDTEPVPPKPKRFMQPPVRAEQIEVALITTHGDKREASKMLGMKMPDLTRRICTNPALKAKWSAAAIKLRNQMVVARLTEEGERTDNRVNLQAHQMEEMAVAQLAECDETRRRLVIIREQILRAEKAEELTAIPIEQRGEEDKLFIGKYARGLPMLELLFKQEVALSQELRAFGETAATINWRHAQIKGITKKNGPKEGPRRGLGVPPKGAAPGNMTMPRVKIENSQVIINPQPAVVNGDNGTTNPV
jgi:hypothetical protein